MNPVQTDIQRTNALNAAGLSIPQQNAVIQGKQLAKPTGFEQINLTPNTVPTPKLPVATPTATYTAPKVSTTAISNTNKMAQVPGIVSTTNALSDTGVRTDPSTGIATYANGTPVRTPEQIANDTEISDYDKQIMANIDNLQSTSDASTSALIDNIRQKYNQRRAEQTDINRAQNNGVNNALLMGGVTGAGSSAQYAPISSEGIIGAQEAYGIKQLSALDAEEQDLIAAAKAAQASNNFKILDMKNQEIEKKRAEKIKVAEELNKSIAETNKKLREQSEQANKDLNISNLYIQGVTDPIEIMKTLNESGGNYTLTQVSDTLAKIVPAGLNDLVKTLRTNLAPESVVQSVLSSRTINDAYKAAGTYASGGTGIIGEYNYYVSQAKAKGEVPLTFREYQDEDSNRKIAQNRASNGLSGTIGQTGAEYTAAQGKYIDSINDKISKNAVYAKTTAMGGFIQNVKNALAQENGVGDIAAINQFQKIIDEGAVTRDQDVKLIQSAQSLSNSLKLRIDKLASGDQLSPSQREQMEKLSTEMYDAQLKALEKDPYISSVKKGLDRNGIALEDTIISDLMNLGERNISTADALLSDEDAARQAIIDYGKEHTEIQDTVRSLAGQVQEELGRAYTWEEIGQIVGVPMQKKNNPLGDKQSINSGLELIRSEEGFVPNAYQDSTGTWTIGYGTTTIDGRPVKPTDKITRQQADEILAKQSSDNYSSYREKINVPLNPNQNAALMSFEYNLGPSIWDQSSAAAILKSINDGNLKEAAAKMLAFNKSRNPKTGKLETNPVLVARRKREAAKLLTA